MKPDPKGSSVSATPQGRLASVEEAGSVSPVSPREILWASFPSFLLGLGYLLFYSQIVFHLVL